MILFLANIWGWTVAHWRLVAGVVAVLFLVIGISLVFRACNKRDAKIDHDTIDRINSKNEAEARKEVREMVEENMDVATTVDNRTTLAEANAVERDRLIEEKIAVVNQKVAEAKQQGRDVTAEELECLLTGNLCR